MNSKKLGLLTLGIALLLFIGFVAWRLLKTDSNTSGTASSNSSQVSQPTKNSTQVYSLTEVATHDTRENCWTVINGNVYDITSYVSSHPGGSDILLACGIDGTSLFTERTTTDGDSVGSGTPHSSQAASQLAQLQIGILGE